MTWRGTWAAGTAYAINDGVSQGGSSYIATTANTGSQPPSANWNLIAQVGAQGPGGATGPAGPSAVSTNAGNLATLGSDSLILVPQSSIWNLRLRSFNAVGNPTFEVDQRNVGNTLAAVAPGTMVQDRWQINKAGTMVVSVGQQSVAAGINLPGTSFAITRSFFRVTLTTQEASLAAGDYLYIQQSLEGTRWREFQNDVHSLQVLVRSSVSGLMVGAALLDPTSAHSLTGLLTIPSANTWTLLPLPNLPVWPGAGTFVNTPGNLGYLLGITLAAGSSYVSPANGSWQNGNFVGAVGQSNFAAQANATFDVAFVQHEPGPVCSTPNDCPFTQNLDDCLRYYQKSYDYKTAVGAVVNNGATGANITSGSWPLYQVSFPKRMAKVPTLTGYSPHTGAANNVYDGTAAVDRVINLASNLGESGFNGFQTATVYSGGTWTVSAHYTADTGW
jgi:hypothetical protein